MFSTRKKRTQPQSDSIDPPRHLYITPSHSKQSSSSSFPSLFQLAARACISHIHLFASLEGLAYNPFGEALYTEFLRRTRQWSLTTEQRRMAIFLFAEAYGDEFLGPEYSGLRCSLVQDIAYIAEFSPCLVYLDLSGSGRPVATANGSSPSVRSISDQDMAGLCSLTKLRILVLSGLKVGDTGLSHLVRGITHGSSGLISLEYLDLSRTDITDVGISKIFVRAPSSHMDSTTQRRQVTSGLVFKKLLGIDLTGSKVHGNVASSLFVQPNRAREDFYQPAIGSSTPPWTRLDDQTRLFPILTAKEQQDKKHQSESATKSHHQPRLYFEEGKDSNPMQRWVDRLNDLPPRLSFGKQPDLSGKGGMGLSESLALLKLDQVPSFTLPDLSPSQLFQQTVQPPPPPLSRRQRRRKWEEPWAEEARSNDVGWAMPQEKPPGMEHMYNLVMYDRVLTTIRDTFGKLLRPTIPNASTTTKSSRSAKRGPLYGSNDEDNVPQTLAFYRKRAVVQEYLEGLEEQKEVLEATLMARNSIKGAIMESTSNARHSERCGILDTSGVSMAKIRAKPNKSRPAEGSSGRKNTLPGSSTLHTSLTLLDLSTSTKETFHSGHGDQIEFYNPLLQSTELTHQPFVGNSTDIPKKRKSPPSSSSSTMTLFSKTNQKKRLISAPTTREALWHRGPSKNRDGRPKNPFVKSNNDEEKEEKESLKSVEGLALDQETIAEPRTKTATTHPSPAFAPPRGGSSSSGSSAARQPKPPTSSANLMMQWVQRKGKDPANNTSSTSTPTPISSGSGATPRQGGDSIIREFYFTEAPKKSVILDRWVHFSSSPSSSTLPISRKENEPRPFRNIIRVDRTSKLFPSQSDNDEQDLE